VANDFVITVVLLAAIYAVVLCGLLVWFLAFVIID